MAFINNFGPFLLSSACVLVLHLLELVTCEYVKYSVTGGGEGINPCNEKKPKPNTKKAALAYWFPDIFCWPAFYSMFLWQFPY